MRTFLNEVGGDDSISKYFKTKATLKIHMKKYYAQDIFRKGTCKTVSGDCSLSPNSMVPSLPNAPNSSHDTLDVFPNINHSGMSDWCCKRPWGQYHGFSRNILQLECIGHSVAFPPPAQPPISPAPAPSTYKECYFWNNQAISVSIELNEVCGLCLMWRAKELFGPRDDFWGRTEERTDENTDGQRI